MKQNKISPVTINLSAYYFLCLSCISGNLGFQSSPRSIPRLGLYNPSLGTICNEISWKSFLV